MFSFKQSHWKYSLLSHYVYQQLVQPGWSHYRLCGSQSLGHGSLELVTYAQNLRHVAEELPVSKKYEWPSRHAKQNNIFCPQSNPPSPGACLFLQMHGPSLRTQSLSAGTKTDGMKKCHHAKETERLLKHRGPFSFYLNPLCVFQLFRLYNWKFTVLGVISGTKLLGASVLLY